MSYVFGSRQPVMREACLESACLIQHRGPFPKPFEQRRVHKFIMKNSSSIPHRLHKDVFSQAQPEVGSLCRNRNRAISEVMCVNAVYGPDDDQPPMVTPASDVWRHSGWCATVMRSNGLVSIDSMHCYGDDPWVWDVWHVLLQDVVCKWCARQDPGLGGRQSIPVRSTDTLRRMCK